MTAPPAIFETARDAMRTILITGATEVWPAVRMILETECLTGQTIHLNAGRDMT